MKTTPKYQTLANKIRKRIFDGIYEPNSLLPSENMLVEDEGISRQTVRQALAVLADEGLIERRQGSGSLVLSVNKRRPLSGNIAVITTYIGEYIFPDILRGIEEVLSKNNYVPILSATQNRVNNERKILTDFLNKPLDGIIVEGTKTALPNPNLDMYRQFYQLDMPIVFIHGHYQELNPPVYVESDDCQGGYDATKFLIAKGHRKIGGIFKSDDMQGHKRYAGYANALRESGLDLMDDCVMWFTTETKDKLRAGDLEELMRGCSAIVCYNDEIAIQVTAAIKESSREVPADIAVISFDNSIYSELSPVKITSCSQDKKQMGMLAAEKLLAMISGKQETPAVVPWTIVEKETT